MKQGSRLQRDYNGVNLVVGDLLAGQLAAGSNRGERKGGPLQLEPGHHAISNGCLRSKWPKARA